MTGQEDTFSGTWQCRHWYPSSDDASEKMSEHTVQVHARGDKLVVEGRPDESTDGSYLMLNLTVDGDLATGTWHETTSPSGEYAGATYSGALQLLVSDNDTRMEGMWVGVGQDNGMRKIYSGRWELTRQG